MQLRQISTYIHFPPGVLSEKAVRELLHLIFEDYRWFTPTSYKDWVDRPIRQGKIDTEALLSIYRSRNWKDITVYGFAYRDFVSIHPVEGTKYPYVGRLHWTTLAGHATKPEWRTVHQTQVKHLMHMLGSPYATTALWEDHQRKTTRLVRRKVGSEEVFTVRDYSEGLAGLYWRNFFGPPFVRMFGDRLASLPSSCVTDLGDGIVLVEPYPLPANAETDEGKARERELIQLLGPECFYDHEHHVPPTRRPDLSDLPSSP